MSRTDFAIVVRHKAGKKSCHCYHFTIIIIYFFFAMLFFPPLTASFSPKQKKMPAKGPQPVDPKLLEKCMKPTMTIAMGMKMTHASTECWRTQVAKEKRLKDEWSNTFRPGWEQEELDIIERVRQREEEHKQAALARPERQLLLDGVSKQGKGRAAYLAERHKLYPQEKWEHPETMSMAVGWEATKLPEIKANDPWKRKKGGGGRYHRPIEMDGMV